MRKSRVHKYMVKRFYSIGWLFIVFLLIFLNGIYLYTILSMFLDLEYSSGLDKILIRNDIKHWIFSTAFVNIFSLTTIITFIYKIERKIWNTLNIIMINLDDTFWEIEDKIKGKE